MSSVKLYNDIRKLIAGSDASYVLDALVRILAMIVVNINIENEVPLKLMLKDIGEDLYGKVMFYIDNHKRDLTDYVI